MTQIIIKHNKFLEPVIAPFVQSHPQYSSWKIPDEGTMSKQVENFKAAWKPLQKNIVSAIEVYTGGPFRYSIVDVALVSTFPRTFSNPIIVGVTKSDNSLVSAEEFICRLTHELIHKAGRYPIQKYRDLFPLETQVTADHIFVHALLKYIFTDVLQRQDLLLLNRELSIKHSTDDYHKAWNIVDDMGYMNLLEIALGEYAHNK